jgi:hypothetical protein
MNNLEYLGKIATKTYKQIEHERLLKAKVIPASELAMRIQEETERAEAFTRSAADESFYNRTEPSVSPRDPSPIGVRVGIISREPYEEQP